MTKSIEITTSLVPLLQLPFTANTLPLAYSHYMTQEIITKYKHSVKDSFDFFLQKRISCLSGFIEQYYDKKNRLPLKLNQIANDSMIKELDTVIAAYLKKGNDYNMREIERCCNRLLEAYKVVLSRA